MRRAAAAVVVTVVAVVLLAGYDTHPPRTHNPKAALPPAVRAPAARAPAARARRPGPGVRTGRGQVITTPFSVIQVGVTLTDGRLTAVRTLALTGDGAHTQALNARAEPILRREALRAGSARIDVVSGATYTSEAYARSLQSALMRAQG